MERVVLTPKETHAPPRPAYQARYADLDAFFDEDDDEELVEEDDDNDDDEEDIVIVPSKKRSVSDLDEDEPKLSRSQRKRLNKKFKAEASGQKQDKVRDVMASMLTDVLFNF